MLIKFNAAKKALAEVTAIDEAKDIQDKMDALRLYFRQQGDSLEMQNQCADIGIRARSRIGQLIQEMQTSGELATQGTGRPKKVFQPDTLNLSDLGITRIQSHRCQKLADIPEKKYERYIAEVKEAEEELTTAGLLRYIDGSAKDIQRISSKSTNEWFTPEKYIEAVKNVLGQIDIDPASNPIANKIIQATVFYTKDDDGLQYDWPGKVWLNPPYGGISRKFAVRLVEQFEDGITTEAILLVNANSTDTKWFVPMWDRTLCFTNHRIDFISSQSTAGGSTHGSVFIYFGQNVEGFLKYFQQFGPIVRRIDIEK